MSGNNLRGMPGQEAHYGHRAGQSLVGLLVVVLIMFALYFMFLGPRMGKNGESRPSIAKQSINRAHDTATVSYVGQIQDAITMYKDDNDGKPPASLQELKNSSQCRGFSEEMWIDQVTKQPLVYDPTTGTISAPPPPGAAPAPGAAPPNGAPAGTAGTSTTVPGGGTITIPQQKMPSDSGDQ